MSGRAAWALPAFAVFGVCGLLLWWLPGVYMDAINPDYLVLNILHPDAAPVFNWAPPGTLLSGRYPVIGQIYHGAMPVYLGLPAYAAFGTHTFGIRVAGVSFGLLVLAAAFAMARARGVRPLIAAPLLLALAADPDFVFAWRTQFAITLLPSAFLMASVALTRTRGFAAAILSGAACGAACYGYFIYAALVPVAFAAAWRAQRRPVAWLCGFALGVAPYFFGMALLMRATGGPAAFAGVLAERVGDLGVAASALPPLAREGFAWALVRETLLTISPARVMFEAPFVALAGPLKLALLVVVPALAAVRGPALVVGWLAGFLGLVLVFGDRLGAHHAIMLLPLLYVALAEACEWFARIRSRVHPARRAAAIAFATLTLIAGNVVDDARVFAELGRTGGVGLSSDALDRFAGDERADPSPRRVFAPDWGVLLSLEMLTDGGVDAIGGGIPEWVRVTLCEARDAEAAFVARPGVDPDARIAAWTAEAHLPPAAVRHYAQHDGPLALAVARWNFRVRGDICLAPAPAAR